MATPSNAEDFVRYFWGVNNYVYRTMDPTLLQSLAEPACSYCKNTAAAIVDLRRMGGRIIGATIHVTSTSAPPIKIHTGIIVQMVLSQDAGEETFKNGVLKKHPAVPSSTGFVGLSWTGNRWLVNDVSLDQSADSP